MLAFFVRQQNSLFISFIMLAFGSAGNCGNQAQRVEENAQCEDGEKGDGTSCESKEDAAADGPFACKPDSLSCEWVDGKFQCGDSATTAVLTSRLGSGNWHACFILDNGDLKCWGGNSSGKLGQGSGNIGDEPGEIASLGPINLGTGRSARQVVGGWDHTCAVLDDATLKCWGNNFHGQIGTDDGLSVSSPVSVDLGTTAVRSVAAGDDQTCGLLADGSVRCWGRSSLGSPGRGEMLQLNLDTDRSAISLTAGGSFACALLDDRSVGCWGHGYNEEGDTGGQVKIVNLGTNCAPLQLSAGRNHICALLADGAIKCWGSNQFGQLGYDESRFDRDPLKESGMGDRLPTVELGTGRHALRVAAGENHTCALLDTYEVKCWGQNAYGDLGLDDTFRRGDGSPKGEKEMGDNLPAVDLGTDRTARDISAGFGHVCVLLDSDQIKCWGHGVQGTTGQGESSIHGDGLPDERDDPGLFEEHPGQIKEMGDNLLPLIL